MTDRDDGDGTDPPADGVSAEGEPPADDAPTRTGPTAADEPPSESAAGADDTSADADGTSTETGAPDARRGDSGERGIVAESVETPGEPRTLHPRVRFEWIVGPLFGAVTVALAAGAGTWAFVHRFLPADRTTSVVGVTAAAFVLFALYGAVKTVYLYRSWRYVVRDESLYLTRGVLTKVQTVVPYVRVQHIDTRRSAFERVLGLSTLVVYTAGSRGADVTIPGLTPDTAEDLQSRLERLAIASEDEDAV